MKMDSSDIFNNTVVESPVIAPHYNIHETLHHIQSNDPDLMIKAAQEIRRLTKTSQGFRRHLSPSIPQLVSMLRVDSAMSSESALRALLNLAVRDELNKMSIVEAGALKPITTFLQQSNNTTLQEYATALLLTLSASSQTKPMITTSGSIPFLVQILHIGTPQAKIDSVIALSNLSTHENNITVILESNPMSSIIGFLKTHKKSSKPAEKCIALLESLVKYEEGRVKLVSEEGGILAVVEALESGTLQSREHAVGLLLTLCEEDRCKYKDPILREGVIPGLLELTVQGSPNSQTKARKLLRLLRDVPYPRSEVVQQSDAFENIFVSNIIISSNDIDDGKEESGDAKKMLADMVQVSMEQSLRHLQQRAVVSKGCD